MKYWLLLILILSLVIFIIIILIKSLRKREREKREAIFAEVMKDRIFALLIDGIRRAGFDIKIDADSLTGMMILRMSKKIRIVGGLLDAFAEKRLAIEVMRLTLTHELGHLKTKKPTDCQFLQSLIGNCLWEELWASKEGLLILSAAGEKNLENYSNAWSHWLLPRIERQCKKCLRAILLNKCPLKKEAKTINEQIEEMLETKK